MKITDAIFVEKEDKEKIDSLVSAFFRNWGSCKYYLVDNKLYYTLVLDDLAGPNLEDKPCAGPIDLKFASTIVSTFSPAVRDFVLEWKENSLSVRVDIFKFSSEDYKYPQTEWEIQDPLEWKQRLDEMNVDHRTLPSYWKELNHVCETVAQIVYNKHKERPAIHTRLGFEQDGVYLLFCNLDYINYSALELISSHAHVVDMTARVWEKRLDIRIKPGKVSVFADRFVGKEEVTREKRKADSEDNNPAPLKM